MIGYDFENTGVRVICIHGHDPTAYAIAHSNALIAQLAAFAMSTLYTWQHDV